MNDSEFAALIHLSLFTTYALLNSSGLQEAHVM